MLFALLLRVSAACLSEPAAALKDVTLFDSNTDMPVCELEGFARLDAPSLSPFHDTREAILVA